eukprot:767223-Hanusia_phi.AAC.1
MEAQNCTYENELKVDSCGLQQTMAAVVPPRSGTMPPDKTPRKTMGGGFRSHEPPRSTLPLKQELRQSLEEPVINSLRYEKSPIQTSVSMVEKEYIRELRQQIKFLEIELSHSREKKSTSQKSTTSARGHTQEEEAAENVEDVAAAAAASASEKANIPKKSDGQRSNLPPKIISQLQDIAFRAYQDLEHKLRTIHQTCTRATAIYRLVKLERASES